MGASIFLNESSVNVTDNFTIGFSINTGASAVMFNSHMNTSGHGLDGLDVISAANLDVDAESSVTASNNGRDGVSIDDGTLNMFGFFVDPGPKLTANDNGNHGRFENDTGTGNDKDDSERKQLNADVVVAFGSRVTFLDNNNVGLALCDATSLARGNVKCRRSPGNALE